MADMMIQRQAAVSSLLPPPAPPPPRCPITIRAAVPGDLAFIDRLQKMHTHAVGWMPTQQLEASIQQGRILLAEETGGELYRLPIARCRWVPSNRQLEIRRNRQCPWAI